MLRKLPPASSRLTLSTPSEAMISEETLRAENAHLLESQVVLEEAREHYAELFDLAPLPLVSVDGAGIISGINRATTTLLGLERRAIVGRLLRSFIAGPDRGKLLRHLTRSRLEEEPLSCDLHLEREEIPVQLRTRQARRGAGVVHAALIDLREWHRVAREQRRLRESERAAREASEAKDRFIAMLSHELRTPLTPVLAAASALREHSEITPYLKGTFELIERNVMTEARLIDDLLDVTRIARSKMSIARQRCDVHQAVRDAQEILAEDIERKQLSVRFDLGAALHHVEGDPTRLRQVFWNLLRNAVKFTQARGIIHLRSWNAGQQLSIEVADSGVGIDAETLRRLFQPFELGDSDRPGNNGGLGLGLAICKGLVELHGGRITASSGGVGRGARFVVQLATSPSSPNAVEAPAPAPDHTAPFARLLLVEDHADTAVVLSELLTQEGYSVQHADSIQAALAVDLEKVDLVVSDIGLPDGTGLDLIRQLQAKGPKRAIALSGFGTEADVRASLDAGFCMHLTKPTDFDRLVEAIRQVSARDIDKAAAKS